MHKPHLEWETEEKQEEKEKGKRRMDSGRNGLARKKKEKKEEKKITEMKRCKEVGSDDKKRAQLERKRDAR